MSERRTPWRSLLSQKTERRGVVSRQRQGGGGTLRSNPPPRPSSGGGNGLEQRRERRRPREEAGYKDSRPIGQGRGTGRIPALVSPRPANSGEREGREVDEQVAALGSAAAADPSSRLLLEKLASPAGGNRASRLGGPRRKEAAKPLSNWRKFRAAPLFFLLRFFFIISRRASRFDEPADWTIASGCLGECRQVTEAPPPYFHLWDVPPAPIGGLCCARKDTQKGKLA